ncbi:MAG: SUMF1/EgtB/PvdO family nonheme iron enzyme [Kouleothrix sp.]|jgi:formylglycine-generating enzyme required for sulfatase activity/energy-coupling factor transporter ATP-binding protein EcfA2|nr:SUMF1/EgtB/PvdO family nonheme iron enzyme [Kouleothrix sp.]
MDWSDGKPMSRKEEFYILAGLLLALLSCIAGFLALPQIQQQLGGWLDNPLFLPLVGLAGLVLILLFILLRDWIVAGLGALINAIPWSRRRGERDYLLAIDQTLGKTPALIASSEGVSYSDLLLLEAFSPLTLHPDSGEAGQKTTLRITDAEAIGSSKLIRSPNRRSPGAQIAYWALWVLAQLLLFALAAALPAWLLWSPTQGWRLDWWRIALGVLALAVWLFAARWLHDRLVADDDRLDDLLQWWRQRQECIAKPGEPGYEVWEHKQLLIRGHPGSGKTTLTRHMAVVCARQRLGIERRVQQRRATSVRALYGWPGCPFPIYIPLRALDLSRQTTDLFGAYVQKLPAIFRAKQAVCDASFFARRLARGGCLVLLDAFDELRDAETRASIAELVLRLPAGPARNPNRFVVTSRIVGYERQLDGTGYVQRRVDDLDDAQAERFIHARYGAIAASEQRTLGPAKNLAWDPQQQATHLLRYLPNNPGLRRLSRNPLLLSLTVSLHHDHHGKGLKLPEERYRLYEEAIRLMVRDWERRKDADAKLEPTDDQSDLNLDERLRLLRELAWMMFEHSAGSTDELAYAVVRRSVARTKLAEVLVVMPGFAPEKTGAARNVHAASEAERWLQNLGQRGGVLQELGNVPGSTDVQIQFAHLTFQEYLAARAAATEDQARRLERILEQWDRPAWREVLLLFAASHDATPVMRHVLARVGNTSTLLAGAVLLERPINLSEDLQTRTLERLRELAFVDGGASEAEALEALQLLEERGSLPDQAELQRAFTAAPYGPVRARALELAVGKRLILPEENRPRLPRPIVAAHLRGRRGPLPARTAIQGPRPVDAHDPPPAALVPALLAAIATDPHHLPRLAAGYLLSAADPRFADKGWIPELVAVPAGDFLMGSVDTDSSARPNEKPQHTLNLPRYWIGKYPVTVAQWRRFVEDDGYRNQDYWTEAGWRFINNDSSSARPWYARLRPARQPSTSNTRNLWQGPVSGDDNLPVVDVSWFEAVAYCRWLSARTKRDFRLPTEAEWEKAARGTDGRIWPWGNEWEAGRCNSSELGLGRRSPVGSFPAGASPYGVLDLAGNVWEWCATKWGKVYPYQIEDEWQAAYLAANDSQVIRGGAYYTERKNVRAPYRIHDGPRYRFIDIGLRVASHSRPDSGS